MKAKYLAARVIAWMVGGLLIALALVAIIGGAAQLGSLVILVVALVGLLVLGGRRKRFKGYG